MSVYILKFPPLHFYNNKPLFFFHHPVRGPSTGDKSSVMIWGKGSSLSQKYKLTSLQIVSMPFQMVWRSWTYFGRGCSTWHFIDFLISLKVAQDHCQIGTLFLNLTSSVTIKPLHTVLQGISKIFLHSISFGRAKLQPSKTQ